LTQGIKRILVYRDTSYVHTQKSDPSLLCEVSVFRRERENGDIMHVPADFGTRPEEVNEVRDVDTDNIARELSAQVEHWNHQTREKFHNLYLWI